MTSEFKFNFGAQFDRDFTKERPNLVLKRNFFEPINSEITVDLIQARKEIGMSDAESITAPENLRADEFIMAQRNAEKLVANQGKIPKDWVGDLVLFPGTVYEDTQTGGQFVPGIYFYGDEYSGRWDMALYALFPPYSCSTDKIAIGRKTNN